MTRILVFKVINLFIYWLFFLNYEKNYVKGGILAIDYGQEWIKAAIVNYGVPIEIVLTKDSKRKDRSVVAFNGEERLYGVHAIDLSRKNPSAVFPSLKLLIGKHYDSDDVKKYLSLYQNVVLVPNKKGSGVAFVQNNRTFTVEELTAMIFENYKTLAEDSIGEKITDVVITVPSYFNEVERYAILDAAEIAGLNVLSLVNEGFAIAINFATTRLFNNDPQYHIIYDMGAGSTTATYVSFRTKYFPNNKTVTILEVMGVGYDRNFGGDTITWKLVDYLLSNFEALKASSFKEPVKSNPKAISKLFQEASRIKQILSVNSEARLTIENFHEGIDYDIKLNRDIFEKLIEEFSEKIKKPLTDAVAMTPVPIRHVSTVILAGGGARVPFVQKQIEALVGSTKVARSVNADEAAVMGAVFRGAGLSGQFRVKNIKLVDITLNSIFISYPDRDDDSKIVTHSLFLKGSGLQVEKTVTFGLLKDFTIVFSHVTGYNLPGTEFATLKLTGLNESVAFLKNEYGNDHDCQEMFSAITFKLDISGLLTVKRAMVECRSKIEDIRDVFRDVHKGYEYKAREDEYIYAEHFNTSNIDKDTENQNYKTKDFAFEISYTGSNPQDKSFKLASRNMLLDLKEVDKKRAARDEARNVLETYIYNVQELLEIEEFIAVSTKEQREELLKTVENVSEWLGTNGEISTLNELVERKKVIEVLEVPISERRNDARQRFDKVSELKRRIEGFIHFLEDLPIEKKEELSNDSGNNAEFDYKKIFNAGHNYGEGFRSQNVIEPGFALETVNAYRENVLKIQKWLDENVATQETLNPWDEPVLKVKDIVLKISELERTKQNILLMQEVYLKSREVFRKNAEKLKSSANESIPVPVESNSTSSSPINATFSESSMHNDF